MYECNLCGSLDERTCGCRQLQGGPGTELREIIPDILKGKDCGCEDVAAWMDRLGPDGCRKNFEKLALHLLAQSDRLVVGSVAPRAVRLAVAERWLNQAINRAEEKLNASPE